MRDTQYPCNLKLTNILRELHQEEVPHKWWPEPAQKKHVNMQWKTTSELKTYDEIMFYKVHKL